MYIHLGDKTIIKSEDIIGVFDMENTSVSKDTKDFLRNKYKRLKIINVSLEMPSSYVLACGKDKIPEVFISHISASTLRKRSGLTGI